MQCMKLQEYTCSSFPIDLILVFHQTSSRADRFRVFLTRFPGNCLAAMVECCQRLCL